MLELILALSLLGNLWAIVRDILYNHTQLYKEALDRAAEQNLELREEILSIKSGKNLS